MYCTYVMRTILYWYLYVIYFSGNSIQLRRKILRVIISAVDSNRADTKDTKTKSRLYLCLIEFIDWRYSQSCWYFRRSFVNYCPSNLLAGSPPPPPFPV
jgi:hypothetical protein